MRVQISHSTVYRYEPPAARVIQLLRLTPRDHEGQHVLRWRIDVSADARLTPHEDAFGNITHVFSAAGPLAELRVDVDGAIETQDTQGVVNGAVERFPPNLFLRATRLTAADEAIRQFAERVRTACTGDALAQAHALLQGLNREMVFDVEMTDIVLSASEAFALKRGVCRDLCHVFIAAARCLGVPARYIAGYLQLADGRIDQEAGHAWAEALIPDIGWVGFDPANGVCPTEAYVRVAVGLDSIGAAPVRGTRFGIGSENLEVAIKVGQ
ncbi:MAG: transglutaminase family protein [Xanthobacteraceae bacterium]|jgi:transglutaminase-like putative cysteine protease